MDRASARARASSSWLERHPTGKATLDKLQNKFAQNQDRKLYAYILPGQLKQLQENTKRRIAVSTY